MDVERPSATETESHISKPHAGATGSTPGPGIWGILGADIILNKPWVAKADSLLRWQSGFAVWRLGKFQRLVGNPLYPKLSHRGDGRLQATSRRPRRTNET